jgi:hypothetical protein
MALLVIRFAYVSVGMEGYLLLVHCDYYLPSRRRLENGTLFLKPVLYLWPRRHLVSGILSVRVAASVERYHLVPGYSRLQSGPISFELT